MEWNAPGIVLSARAYGEGDAVAAVFTRDQGVCRGLAKGGASRSKSSTWQAGNLVEARWVARLADQLGSFTAELVHPTAARTMDDPLALSILSAACAVAEGAIVERQAHPRVFQGLLHLLAHLGGEPATSLADLAAWELELLAELGYGLDLSRCALTGDTTGLQFVSPRTGRAVSAAAAGEWAGRLLPLPAFLVPGANETTPELASCRDALRLTGHFLTRDAFGAQHKPLPQARSMLSERIEKLAGTDSPAPAGSEEG